MCTDVGPWEILDTCVPRGCTIKINLLGFSKFLYHCFLETVGIFTVPNLFYLFGMISEYRDISPRCHI